MCQWRALLLPTSVPLSQMLIFLRRSRPRSRIGPPETQRRAYVDAGYDVRWNADHAGHGMPETRLSPQGSRKPRLLHRAGSTHTILGAPALGVSLNFAAYRRPPASGSSNLTSLFHLTGAWGTIPQIATRLHTLQSHQIAAVAAAAGPTARLQFMAHREHFAATQQFGRFGVEDIQRARGCRRPISPSSC